MRLYVLLAAFFLLGVSPIRADSIVNGGFESFVVGPHDTDFGTFLRLFSPPANTDIAGWTISGSSGGHPNSVDLVHSSLWPPFSGTQSLDMEGAVGASGVIFQSFTTMAGDMYNLSFEYGNNPDGSGGTMNILVTGNGTLVDQNVSHNTSTVADIDYTLFSRTFTANSASTTLQFSAVTNSGFGVVIDDVSVNPASVPEPSTLVLLPAAGAFLMLRKRYCSKRIATR